MAARSDCEEKAKLNNLKPILGTLGATKGLGTMERAQSDVCWEIPLAAGK